LGNKLCTPAVVLGLQNGIYFQRSKCKVFILLLRPCEVLSRIANPTILEVAHYPLRILLQHHHVVVGRFT